MSKRTTFARRARTLRAERRLAPRVGRMGVVAAPVALFYELSALLYETQSDSFTVSAANLARTTAYTISLSAATAGGTNVSGNDVGFNSTCSTASKTLTIPANSAAYSTTVTLYACDDEGGGGTITAQLKAGATAVNSASQFVSVKAISVEASVSDPFPSSSDSVTLTASVDGPSGASYTYQWQQKSGATWASISGATSSTLSRSFSTRGTRVFRVRATYGSTTTTSEAVMPTWDGENIVIDMLSAMERRVVALSAYTTAQTAFLNCVQRRTGTSLASFDAALDRYAGRTKTAVDACESSGAPRSGALPALARTTMFATYQRLSKQELAAMRRTNSEYDLLLSTDLGREFLDSVSSPEIVKRYAGYIAQSGGGGVSGQASVTGFDCIPATAPSSLTRKLEALNCLVFDTPHSWWVTNVLVLKRRIEPPSTYPQYSFLQYGAGDKCSFSPDGPTPSCRKHDLAYASLRYFVGGTDSDELDTVWNPVNKYLADSKFYRDVEQHGCESPSKIAEETLCTLDKKEMANVYHWGVAVAVGFNLAPTERR